MYNKLCALFGSEDVISISSDGPTDRPINNSEAPIIIKDSDDEVESPMPLKTTIACQKKLFANDPVVNEKKPIFDYKKAHTPFRIKGVPPAGGGSSKDASFDGPASP